MHGAGAQTRIFASIDLAVSLLTLATQVFATGWLLKRFGTGIAAGALPLVYVVGFAALAVSPSLTVVLTLQVVQRWMNFAIANPARQVFFTVVTREEKYKAKNLIDVVVYRGSDALYGWVFDSLQLFGTEAGRHRSMRTTGDGRLAGAVGGFRDDAGTPVPSGSSRRWRREADMAIQITRREFAVLAGSAVLAPPALAQSDALLTRAIPSSGELLPAVGLGTAQVFDTASETTRARRPKWCRL